MSRHGARGIALRIRETRAWPWSGPASWAWRTSLRAVGASIRNFGLGWPVWQPAGVLHERALRSCEIRREVAALSGIWAAESGSLHLAYRGDGQAVLEEHMETTPTARKAGCRLLSPDEVARKSAAARRDGLLGAWWSPTNVNVDPRQGRTRKERG